MTGQPWPAVKDEHLSLDGWVEGPHNENPWTDELFGYHAPAAYCASEATVVTYHHGVVWPDDAQNAPRGFAYCPYLVTWAVNHGLFEWDRTSSGAPAMVHEGDLLLWDWKSDGVADHCETALADDDGADGYVHNIFGANTGVPEGCHAGLSRPRRYLLGVVHMCLWAYKDNNPPPALPDCPPTPPPEPAPVPEPGLPSQGGNPWLPLREDGQRGPVTNKALQWFLWAAGSSDINGNVLTDDGDFGYLSNTSLQRYLGVSIDGDFGRQSTMALQAHLGVRQDAWWGAQTTRALQQALNSYTF